MCECVRSCVHPIGVSHFTVKKGKRNVSIVNMPVCPVQVVGGAWLFSRLYCNIFVTLDVMMCTASILNLCAISIDRWVCSVCVGMGVCLPSCCSCCVWLQMLPRHLENKCHPCEISIFQGLIIYYILLYSSPHRNFKTSWRKTLFSPFGYILLINACIVCVSGWQNERQWGRHMKEEILCKLCVFDWLFNNCFSDMFTSNCCAFVCINAGGAVLCHQVEPFL